MKANSLLSIILVGWLQLWPLPFMQKTIKMGYVAGFSYTVVAL